jgi:hypothetical protein
MNRLKFVVGTLAVLIGMGGMSYAQDIDDNTHLGTWIVTLTPPAASGRPAFSALLTFASGGAFIASTQNDHLVPSSDVQQGSWRRGDHGEINSSQLVFVYAPTGMAVGTSKVRATYDFPDAESLTGQGQLLRCDLNGANCIVAPGLASIEGKRVEVEEPVGP